MPARNGKIVNEPTPQPVFAKWSGKFRITLCVFFWSGVAKYKDIGYTSKSKCFVCFPFQVQLESKGILAWVVGENATNTFLLSQKYGDGETSNFPVDFDSN